MNNLVYAILPNKLFNAFQRYLHYIFKIEIKKGIPSQFKQNGKFYLFIHEQELENCDIFKYDIKVVILGYNNNKQKNYINLLDLKNFNSNLSQIFSSNNIDNQETTDIRHQIREKLVTFFKGHGEESLLSCLYSTQYYLSNGPVLFQKGNINYDEYKKTFLLPGIENWEIFSNRLNKYKNYLFVAGFENEVGEVILKTKQFQIFVDKLKIMTKSQLEETSLNTFVEENISIIKEIDNIFSNIYRKLEKK